jgi:hypothetical protein
VYQKNKLPEALDFYNQSILLAPHPPPPNMFMMPAIHEQPQEEVFPHEELALGYANRSAVLFQVCFISPSLVYYISRSVFFSFLSILFSPPLTFSLYFCRSLFHSLSLSLSLSLFKLLFIFF